MTHCVVFVMCSLVSAAPAESDVPFAKARRIDPQIQGVTSVQAADIDRDGRTDLAVFEGGKHAGNRRTCAWFQAPNWQRHEISAEPPGPFVGHSALVDIDGDGSLDVVLPEDAHSGNDTTARLFWFRNPGHTAPGPWVRKTIAELTDTQHVGGIVVTDMDGDGRVDVVLRHLGKPSVRICFQDEQSAWFVRTLPVRLREGVAVADLDADGRQDIVLNGFWWAGPSDWRRDEPRELVIDTTFYSQPRKGLNNSTKQAVADIDGDGRQDVVYSVAEGANAYLAWYRAPEDRRTQNWERHVIEDNWSGGHQVLLGDVDLDGDIDLVTGLSFGKTGVFLYRNQKKGAAFHKQVLSHDLGLYYGILADIGDDGDLDVVGPSTYSKTGSVYLFENLSK